MKQSLLMVVLSFVFFHSTPFRKKQLKHQKNTRLITKVNFTFSGEEIENPIQIRIFTLKEKTMILL